MPIGADMGLPKRSGGRPSPLSMPRQAPPMISDSAVQSQVNNTRAAGIGGGRVAMQAMDRAGVSRGRGQQARADMAEAIGDVQSRLSANQAASGAAASNAQAKFAYDAAMQGEQMAGAGLLEGLRNARAMAALQRQGFGRDQYEAAARGKLGLDSIYLDRTPLLNALMQ